MSAEEEEETVGLNDTGLVRWLGTSPQNRMYPICSLTPGTWLGADAAAAEYINYSSCSGSDVLSVTKHASGNKSVTGTGYGLSAVRPLIRYFHLNGGGRLHFSECTDADKGFVPVD